MPGSGWRDKALADGVRLTGLRVATHRLRRSPERTFGR